MNDEEKGDPLQGKDIPSTGVGSEVKSVSVTKLQSFFLESDLSRQLKWLPGSCVIRAGATSSCLGLARWQRLQALDFSCHKIRSVAWVCLETWTLQARSGF